MANRLLVALLVSCLVGCAARTAPQSGATGPQSAPAASAGVITSGPVVEDAVALTAPETAPPTAEASEGGPSVLAVHLRKSGETAVNGEPVAGMSGALARAREVLAAKVEDLRVMLYVDTGVKPKRLGEALEQLRGAGLTRVGVVLDSDRAGAAPGGGSSDSVAPARAGSLPEVVVENVGLHIGGGPNDDASKEPFRRTIAAHFDDFRRCYTLVNSPGQGGTFGVDLRIGRSGGRAQVRQPRPGMGGQEFRDCVLKVFSEVEFERPPRGPTVISYSLRYTVGGE